MGGRKEIADSCDTIHLYGPVHDNRGESLENIARQQFVGEDPVLYPVSAGIDAASPPELSYL